MLIESKKKFKPIANGNVTDSGMIALTDEPLPCQKNLKKNGGLHRGGSRGWNKGTGLPLKFNF